MNTMNTAPSPLKLRSFLTYRLNRLHTKINAQAQHILRMYSDLGQTEWRVLVLVEDHGESTMAEVVREGQIDKAQVSRGVKSLISKGYLETRPDPDDQRQSILRATPKGGEVVAHILPKMRARQQNMMAQMSEDEIALIYELFDRLEVAAEQRDF